MHHLENKSIYPEVEHPAVVLVKALLHRNNLLQDEILECQSSDGSEKPAVS